MVLFPSEPNIFNFQGALPLGYWVFTEVEYPNLLIKLYEEV